MLEYIDLLKEYSAQCYSVFCPNKPLPNWADHSIAEKYFQQYWLSKNEYEVTWKPIQNSIFINQNISLPEILFPAEYEMIALRGGSLFMQHEFEAFQKCLLALGETHFVIIQNKFDLFPDEAALRMKYPVSISWSELMDGDFISAILFFATFNEYFVFGATTHWGRYAASDALWPLNITGFKAKYSSIFHQYLTQTEKEAQEIKEWLPEEYEDRIYLNINSIRERNE